jgi:hypothetical protein
METLFGLLETRITFSELAGKLAGDGRRRVMQALVRACPLV